MDLNIQEINKLGNDMSKLDNDIKHSIWIAFGGYLTQAKDMDCFSLDNVFLVETAETQLHSLRDKLVTQNGCFHLLEQLANVDSILYRLGEFKKQLQKLR